MNNDEDKKAAFKRARERRQGPLPSASPGRAPRPAWGDRTWPRGSRPQAYV